MRVFTFITSIVMFWFAFGLIVLASQSGNMLGYIIALFPIITSGTCGYLTFYGDQNNYYEKGKTTQVCGQGDPKETGFL